MNVGDITTLAAIENRVGVGVMAIRKALKVVLSVALVTHAFIAPERITERQWGRVQRVMLDV